MPDGLQHSKFRQRKGQRAMYITCWKDLFSPNNLNRGKPKSSPNSSPHDSLAHSPHAPNATFHKHLAMQIEHHLRVRVIQELQLLAKALPRRLKKNEPEPAILRRLTRAEFRELRETGVIPHPDAVAVLVVPPVNRHPAARVRPVPSMQPEIVEGVQSSSDTSATLRKRPLPLSTMHCIQLEPPQQVELSFASLVPNAQVPLYNGLSMFPSASQRAALHKSLCQVLEAERRSRSRKPSARNDSRDGGPASSGDKGSHAFLLISNERTVKRADSVALSIALWRLRMWQGDSYQSQSCSGGWEVDGEWRMKYAQSTGWQ